VAHDDCHKLMSLCRENSCVRDYGAKRTLYNNIRSRNHIVAKTAYQENKYND